MFCLWAMKAFASTSRSMRELQCCGCTAALERSLLRHEPFSSATDYQILVRSPHASSSRLFSIWIKTVLINIFKPRDNSFSAECSWFLLGFFFKWLGASSRLLAGCGKAAVTSGQFGAACACLSSVTNGLLLPPQAEPEAHYEQALGDVSSSAIADLLENRLYFSEVVF